MYVIISYFDLFSHEKFLAKMGQNLEFFGTWELYTSEESLEHVQYKFKKKKYDFLKKKLFFKIFDFFSVKKNFFRFSKILKINPKNDFHGTIQT